MVHLDRTKIAAGKRIDYHLVHAALLAKGGLINRQGGRKLDRI
jgi:hypothetical protein